MACSIRESAMSSGLARVGAAIVLLAVVAAAHRSLGDAVRPVRSGSRVAPRRSDGAATGSVSTSSAATSWRGCWPAHASRCSSASSSSECRRASASCLVRWLDISAAGWTKPSRVSSTSCWRFQGCCWRLPWWRFWVPACGTSLLALTLIGWVGYARLVRGQVLRAREFEYVQAARALGASTSRILARHVMPSAMPAVTVQATLGMGGGHPVGGRRSVSSVWASSRRRPAGERC